MKLIIAIKHYMEADGGRKVGMDEMKGFKEAMTLADRAEYTAWFRANGTEIEE